MSHQLISRSADLQRLRNEGYEVDIRSGHLVVKSVPYVNREREISLGTVVSKLVMAGDRTAPPDTHVVYFVGEVPCTKNGEPISEIINKSQQLTLASDLVVDHTFSSKPTGGKYADYYEKMTTYIAIVSHPAMAIDPSATAQTFAPVEMNEEESVFKYLDTASSRAGIQLVSEKLELERIAIVGVGGTGSYILDYVAKCPIREIHLFDGDRLYSHNAFRSPGAASLDELKSRPLKVQYLADRYSRMRRGISPHSFYVDDTTVSELKGMQFVFLCLDKGEAKRSIVDRLEEWKIPFIDVGMGIKLVSGSLLGVLRVTASTREKRDHVHEKNRIPFSNGEDDNEYSQNIQIADLNAFNAALAVIRWKKMFGFYADFEQEHFSAYTIDGNSLVNEDLQCSET